jgi:biotin synthase-related radical SAM superfamily protein
MIRLSAGTAVALGLKSFKVDILPTTAYLMLGGDCPKACAFCPQGSHPDKEKSSDFLSRISWHPFEDEVVLAALTSHLCLPNSHLLKRVCLQLVSGKGIVKQALNFAAQLLQSRYVSISISSHYFSWEDFQQANALGIDTLCFPLDLARNDLYKRLKGGNWNQALSYLEKARQYFKGNIATHIIIGLGESESDLINLFQTLHQKNIRFGLFAFTPIPGTPLANHPIPSLKTYRKMQIARWLIINKPDFNFVIRNGVWQEEKWQTLANLIEGVAFRTSGCPDCNRPYYNEKPQGPWYNYPRALSEEERDQAIAEAFS